MIRIEHTEVSGWNAAIRGMRNPHDSWDKSDSYWTLIEDPETHQTARFEFFMGEEDLKLAKKLAKAGDDHGKFLRMIHVSCDIVAPFYWLKEFDTYKISVTSNSCSTMHKIHKKEFTLDDFSHEHLIDIEDDETNGRKCCIYDCEEHKLIFPKNLLEQTVALLNEARLACSETNDKKYWWQMIQLLPSSYNQRRTVDLNYQTLAHMYHARKNHKLDEWHAFCEWIESLPYFNEMCLEGMG